MTSLVWEHFPFSSSFTWAFSIHQSPVGRPLFSVKSWPSHFTTFVFKWHLIYRTRQTRPSTVDVKYRSEPSVSTLECKLWPGTGVVYPWFRVCTSYFTEEKPNFSIISLSTNGSSHVRSQTRSFDPFVVYHLSNEEDECLVYFTPSPQQ